MSSLKLINNIINQRGTPAFNSNTIANRPAAGYVGRIFISTDTFVIQRDNGTSWDNIGGGGITGTGAAGQVAFWTGASAQSGDNAIFWDNTNKRLGLGTTTPGTRLDVHGTGVIQQLNGTTTNSAFLDFQNAGTTRFRIGNDYNGGANNFNIFNLATNENQIGITQSNGYMRFNSPSNANQGNLYEFYAINKSNSALSFFNYKNDSSGADFYFYKSRGTTYASNIQTQNNDTLCSMGFAGINSSNAVFSGAIWRCYQDGAAGASVPASMVWSMYTASNTFVDRLKLITSGYSTFADRLNVNNATDNSLFELNVNGNTYTGGLSPTILTVGTNTTMARTATGYYCTATLTLTLPSAASINNVYWVIAASGVTVTVNRAGTDDILNLAGTSVTSITITSNQRAMFYVGGGTRTFLISQA